LEITLNHTIVPSHDNVGKMKLEVFGPNSVKNPKIILIDPVDKSYNPIPQSQELQIVQCTNWSQEYKYIQPL